MRRVFIPAIMLSALAVTLECLPAQTVRAESSSEIAMVCEDNNGKFEEINPRFTYVQSADIGVYPSDAEVAYDMYIRGISEVTGVSGTMTLYKKKANGDFEEKESTEVNLSGSKVRCSGSFKSYGQGEYKLVFSGTVHAKSGSESVTFRNFNSY
ncbi:MAG: hypothetical protein K2N73_06740 [Lachnospiraceae bacterium]|nr:hypothetical protein [Lachnospiraceae bacterium]